MPLSPHAGGETECPGMAVRISADLCCGLPALSLSECLSYLIILPGCLIFSQVHYPPGALSLLGSCLYFVELLLFIGGLLSPKNRARFASWTGLTNVTCSLASLPTGLLLTGEKARLHELAVENLNATPIVSAENSFCSESVRGDEEHTGSTSSLTDRSSLFRRRLTYPTSQEMLDGMLASHGIFLNDRHGRVN